jgi:hypothetical protein
MNREQIRRAHGAMREWNYNEKLRESGLRDIEGGVDGHLLQGERPTISLFSLANRATADGGLNEGNVLRTFAEVADADDPRLLFSRSSRARYYHHAELIATQAFREGQLDADTCYTWWLHAIGLSERDICETLEVSRERVHRYVQTLVQNIEYRLDIEVSD